MQQRGRAGGRLCCCDTWTCGSVGRPWASAHRSTAALPLRTAAAPGSHELAGVPWKSGGGRRTRYMVQPAACCCWIGKRGSAGRAACRSRGVRAQLRAADVRASRAAGWAPSGYQGTGRGVELRARQPPPEHLRFAPPRLRPRIAVGPSHHPHHPATAADTCLSVSHASCAVQSGWAAAAATARYGCYRQGRSPCTLPLPTLLAARQAQGVQLPLPAASATRSCRKS